MSERQGVEIDYCPKCRGVWLDRGELDKIIEHAAAADFGQPQTRDGPQRQDDYRRSRDHGHAHGRGHGGGHHGGSLRNFLGGYFDV